MHVLHSNMAAAKRGKENSILDILCMTVQKSLAYIDRYLISDLRIVHIYGDYFKSEIVVLVNRFMS